MGQEEDYDDKLPPAWFASRDFAITLAAIALPILAVVFWRVVLG